MRNHRARGVTADNKPIFDETHEHECVAHFLLINKISFIHVPNEGKRSWATGKRLKRMGMKKGAPDFIVFDPPPAHPHHVGAMLELKALDGDKPSKEQYEFLEMGARRGWKTHWVKGSDEAIRWFESLGYGLR